MGFGTNEKGSGGLLDQAGKSYEWARFYKTAIVGKSTLYFAFLT